MTNRPGIIIYLNLLCIYLNPRIKSTAADIRCGRHDRLKLQKKLVIINELGLHARAAAKIAAIAGRAKSRVWIAKDDHTVDAASIIEILTLAGTQGSHVVLSVDDPEDKDLLQQIETLFNNGFGE